MSGRIYARSGWIARSRTGCGEHLLREVDALEADMDVMLCTDVWYLNNDALQPRPTVSVAGRVNALSAFLIDKVPTAFAIDDVLSIHMDAEDADPIACVWDEPRGRWRAGWTRSASGTRSGSCGWLRRGRGRAEGAYLPMQNVVKMRPRTSSGEISPASWASSSSATRRWPARRSRWSIKDARCETRRAADARARR
ncbi:MAG: hypothetical protein R3B46_01725 [Phycisphaerales bacterium]